jgi:hypothetical protein
LEKNISILSYGLDWPPAHYLRYAEGKERRIKMYNSSVMSIGYVSKIVNKFKKIFEPVRVGPNNDS